jgi:hypothetical protein
MQIETMVRELWDRELIAKVPRTYSRGVDRRDWALVRSCFSEDCYVDGSRASAPIDDYLAGLIPGVEYFPVTMHYMGNQMVEVEGDSGYVESYCVAFHWKSAEQPGGDHPQNLVVGVRYHDTMKRVGDKWIIARRKVDPDWRNGPYPPM